jgi:hypothetical protein
MPHRDLAAFLKPVRIDQQAVLVEHVVRRRVLPVRKLVIGCLPTRPGHSGLRGHFLIRQQRRPHLVISGTVHVNFLTVMRKEISAALLYRNGS